jgi:hypothetical protein
MSCKCSNMNPRVIGWSSSKPFKNMVKVKVVDDGFRVIVECKNCGQYWLVDEFDKVSSLFAIKIGNPNKPDEIQMFRIHEESLIHEYGVSYTQCHFAGCNNKALVSKAICASCSIKRMGCYE